MYDKIDKITETVNEVLDECENITQKIMLLSYIQSMIDFLLKHFIKTAYDMSWDGEDKENEMS